jgi:hypothetical protein
MDGMSDDLHGPGWWVGSDGNWHPPEEDFDADVPRRAHPARRVAVVLLAVAIVGATTVGAWLGSSSGSPASDGPPLAQLDAQVQQVVVGTGANQFGVSDVAEVVCGPAKAWIQGDTFQCSVYASGHRKIGVYDGTVEPSSSAGTWRWSGEWYPILRPATTE